MIFKRLIMGLSAIIVVFCLIGCEEESKKRQRQETLEQEPVLIATKNGVKVWRILDKENYSRPVYFTTPSDDVTWTVPGDDDTPDVHYTVPGLKKK